MGLLELHKMYREMGGAIDFLQEFLQGIVNKGDLIYTYHSFCMAALTVCSDSWRWVKRIGSRGIAVIDPGSLSIECLELGDKKLKRGNIPPPPPEKATDTSTWSVSAGKGCSVPVGDSP